ncbi:MAG: type II secretion system protein [Vicinamibacterales bacterium]
MARSTATGRARSARGFTIIELMVVISIIVVLATIAMVQYRQSVIFARESVLKDDLFKMREAIDQYYADRNQYPSSLEDLVEGGYLRALPKDPMTNSADSWQEVPAELDPNNPASQPGVYDVKSGSEGTAVDGTRYSDW